MFRRLTAPQYAYQLARYVGPWALCIALMAFGVGLWGALWVAPPDYQQGEAYRILFIHVPAAALSLGLYSVMACSSFVFGVWHVKVLDALAEACAPLGALFAALTLVTGSLWGKPMWGTYWIWDARLTSELILFFIYMGIMGLRHTLRATNMGSQAVTIMTLVGAINLPIIHYSVQWWHTLHQGPTILKWGTPAIAPSMLWPLLWMFGALTAFSMAWISLRFRESLLQRYADARWVMLLRAG